MGMSPFAPSTLLSLAWGVLASLVACWLVISSVDEPQGLLHKLMLQNSSFESFLKNVKYALSYIAILTKGELKLRLASVLASVCAYGVLWTKWPQLNWIQIVLETGLLIRAAKLAWDVLQWHRFHLTTSELKLYDTHIRDHGLTKREFFALLRAGAEWRSSQDKGLVIQGEGRVVEKLSLIHSGTCAVLAGEIQISTLGPGDLVGEATFAQLTDTWEARGSPRRNIQNWLHVGGAPTTVSTLEPVEYVSWPIVRLEGALRQSSSVKACLMTMIAASLAKKLRKATQRIEAAEEFLVDREIDKTTRPS
ncbi:MAG: hypothetical protein SGPRY_008077 [Prymnesium sp.]